jgi:hypothetical protein
MDNAYEKARKNAKASLAAAAALDRRLTDIVATATTAADVEELQALCAKRLAVHARVTADARYFRQSFTRPVADVVRAALLRGDFAAAAAGFAAEVFAVDGKVDAVYSKLKISHDDVEGVAAAAWPTFRQRHKLPADARLPPRVIDAVAAVVAKTPTGQLVVSDDYAEARAAWIASDRGAAERWAPHTVANVVAEQQVADRQWRANMAAHGLHT